MKRMVILAAALAAAVTGTAFAGSFGGNPFEGKIGKGVIGFNAFLGKGGTVTLIKGFSWEAAICGPEKFTGGVKGSIPVTNDKFKVTRPVSGVSVKLTVTVAGSFKLDETKATGWLTLTGACSSHGKRYWSATVRR
jgi:hypothetical protein